MPTDRSLLRPATWLSGFALTLCMHIGPASSQSLHWTVYTHSVADAAEVVDRSLVGKVGAGKRAYYIEVMRALLGELKIEARITEVPFARGMRYLTSDERVAFFNVVRTPERKDKAIWIGPVLAERSYLYEFTSNPTGIQTLSEAKQRSVCVLNQGVHEQRLSALGFTNLLRQNSYTDCFRMLGVKRVELVASASLGLAAKLATAKLDVDEVKQTPALIDEEVGYITLSRLTPVEEVERWSSAFKKLKANGTLGRLHKKFIP